MRYLMTSVFALLPGLAAAHPHIFIETRVEIVLNAEGAVTGVEIEWTYDEFFSLILLEDLMLDDDLDYVLTAEEQLILEEEVLGWPEHFTGDLLVEAGGISAEFGPREKHTVDYVDGRVIERHLRPLKAPLSTADGASVRVFDPTYYTAYVLTGEIGLTGPEGCGVTVTPADLDAAYSLIDEMLYGTPADQLDPDDPFPEVGAEFADTITVTCPGS